MKHSSKRAFTLVEIMIVVLIIGILVAIAVPNFIKARESARSRACVKNLTLIAAAKEQWAMDNRIPADMSTPISIAALTVAGVGVNNAYLKTYPVCPSGGGYSANILAADPTCSIAATANPAHVMP